MSRANAGLSRQGIANGPSPRHHLSSIQYIITPRPAARIHRGPAGPDRPGRKVAGTKLGLGTQGPPWTLAFVLAAFVTSIALAVLAYRLLEQPLTCAAQRRLRSRWAAANV